MAKKKASGKEKLASGVKKLVSEYKNKAISTIVDFVEKESGNIISWFKDMMKIKQAIRKFVVSTIICLAALVVMFLGIANYIAELSGINEGLMQIIVGVVLLIVAAVYKKS